MWSLSETRFLIPTTWEQAVVMLANEPGSMPIAGGTDLMPNLRYGLASPSTMIGLTRIARGPMSFMDGGTLVLCGLATMTQLLSDPTVAIHAPELVEAARVLAGPAQRNMATLGGNIALDTRCIWYNRSKRERDGFSGCLKTEGIICRVINGQACVAARSGDTIAPLILRGAVLDVLTPEGERLIPLANAMGKSGLFGPHLALPSHSLIRCVRIPPAPAGWRATYIKVAERSDIDYPILSLAVGGEFEGTRCRFIRVVVSAMMPRPRLHEFTVGERLTREIIERIVQAVARATKPLDNIGNPVRIGFQDWRKHLLAVRLRETLTSL